MLLAEMMLNEINTVKPSSFPSLSGVRVYLALGNSRHFTTPQLVSPRNDVWEMNAEIPYWWRVTIQIWVVLLIGWSKFPTRHDQSETLPRSGWWWVISMEFLCSFLRRHFAGKPVVGSWNVGCFLKLEPTLPVTVIRVSNTFQIKIPEVFK